MKAQYSHLFLRALLLVFFPSLTRCLKVFSLSRRAGGTQGDGANANETKKTLGKDGAIFDTAGVAIDESKLTMFLVVLGLS